MTTRIDCAVIGAGPAGLTAAHYLRRFRRKVAIFGHGDSRASHIPRTHNFPGFPGGIAGPELLARMRRQLEDCGGRVLDQCVQAVNSDGDGFAVRTEAQTMGARTVLMATGVRDVEPKLPHIADLRRRGLLRQCPVCDGFEFADRAVGVIGAGKHGVAEAEFLRHFTSRVTFVTLHGEADLDSEAREALRAHAIPAVVAATIDAVTDGDGVVVSMADGRSLSFDVLYSALGSVPNAKLAAPLGAATDDNGNLVVDAHCRTSARGVYAAGDVVTALDQLAVAVGHAAIAATAIHNDLRGARV